MKKPRNIIAAITAALGMFILIMDTKTAVAGAQEGIKQCIRVIIPSIFPFFLVSGMFCQSMQQMYLSFLSPIRKLCKMPHGSEPLLIVGLLGGYPVGAKEIANMYKAGMIDKKNAERMLGFCSNAGPSFIFGIIASQFTSQAAAFWILGIQILSAIITAAILPGYNEGPVKINVKGTSLISVFNGSIRSIASVCGWVILFRVILAFFNRWFLWSTPDFIGVIVSGVLELANGCVQLHKIQNEGLRMIISSAILSAGGVCVYLQTISVTQGLGTVMYFSGKMIQCCVSIILSGIAQIIIFKASETISIKYLWVPIFVIPLIYAIISTEYSKKTVAIQRNMIYNQ